ncbi:MAG: hypothetical protein OEL85_09225 [Desulfobulbaceae bacterium]|nr:hypothetical protein [Desulfobulbaceae bacterium]
MPALLLSASWLARMAAAVLKIQQFKGVVFYEQGKLFGQRHGLGKIADNIFDVWFFLLGAHGNPIQK